MKTSRRGVFLRAGGFSGSPGAVRRCSGVGGRGDDCYECDETGGVNPGSELSHNARSARGARALRARSARGFFPSRAENARREGTARRRSKTQNFPKHTMQSCARDSRDLKTIFQKVEMFLGKNIFSPFEKNLYNFGKNTPA